MTDNHFTQISYLIDNDEFAGPQHKRITELLLEARALPSKRKRKPSVVGAPNLSDADILEAVAKFFDLLPDWWVGVAGDRGRLAIAYMPVKCWPHKNPAMYETSPTRFRWAEFLCELCAYDYWELPLGSGSATYLLHLNDVPSPVRALCAAATVELGREPCFPQDRT